MPPRVLLIGRTDHEFQGMHHWLRGHVELANACDMQSLPEPLDCFDIILIAMSLRFQFTLPDVQRLRAAAPLARLCAVVGSWCEGETRSGSAWPGVERMYVHQVIPRAIEENWPAQVPFSAATFSNDEYWLERAARDDGRPRHHGLVVICCADLAAGDSLALVCQRSGFGTILMRPASICGHNAAQAVIYDADRNREVRLRQVEQLSFAFPAARLTTLLEFPRHDEIAQILAAGGHQVLGKPFDIDDLTSCLTPACACTEPARPTP